MKVENFYHKNQFVITSPKKTVFQSYDSKICEVTEKGVKIYPHWDYSNTTRKHLYMFLKQYAPRLDINGRKDILKLIKDKTLIKGRY